MSSEEEKKMASLQFAILWYFCFSVHWVVNGASGDEYYIGTGRYDITGPAVETEMVCVCVD